MFKLTSCSLALFLIFFRELENRQNVEVEKRQQQTENKSLKNNVQQLESDVRDLKRALAEEQEARAVQGQLLDDEKRKNEALVEESRNHSIQKSEALYQLEAVDQTRKSYEASSGSLREELKATQVRLKYKFSSLNDLVVRQGVSVRIQDFSWGEGVGTPLNEF